MIKGAHTLSLRVHKVPFGRSWCVFIQHIFKVLLAQNIAMFARILFFKVRFCELHHLFSFRRWIPLPNVTVNTEPEDPGIQPNMGSVVNFAGNPPWEILQPQSSPQFSRLSSQFLQSKTDVIPPRSDHVPWGHGVPGRKSDAFLHPASVALRIQWLDLLGVYKFGEKTTPQPFPAKSEKNS